MGPPKKKRYISATVQNLSLIFFTGCRGDNWTYCRQHLYENIEKPKSFFVMFEL